MTTWSDTNKNTTSWGESDKSTIAQPDLEFKIDDTYSLLIDDTYEFLIQSATAGTIWSEQNKS